MGRKQSTVQVNLLFDLTDPTQRRLLLALQQVPKGSRQRFIQEALADKFWGHVDSQSVQPAQVIQPAPSITIDTQALADVLKVTVESSLQGVENSLQGFGQVMQQSMSSLASQVRSWTPPPAASQSAEPSTDDPFANLDLSGSIAVSAEGPAQEELTDEEITARLLASGHLE